MKHLLAIAMCLAACRAAPTAEPEEPPEAPVTAPAPAFVPKYQDDCQVNFRGDPRDAARRRKESAKRYIDMGGEMLAKVTKTTPVEEAVNGVREAIDKYRLALQEDPYNVEATLQLAVAYDRAYRKGCALALLKRLYALDEWPNTRLEAERAIDSVTDNPQMFRGYRNDAINALGR